MSIISSTKRNKALSVFTLVMINVIAIDSLRNLPANAVVGLSIASFYLIAAILFLIPCVLVTAELATHYPKTGGAYVWVREAFGPKWGFVCIWLQWIYNVVWYPTVLSFLAANIAYLINPALATNKLYMVSMIIGLFSIATIVNFFGMKISGMISTFSAIIGTILPMLFIIALGFYWLNHGDLISATPTWQSFIPSISHDNNLAFLVVVLFSLMGLEMSAVHAEEVKNPQRDYPRALLWSSLIIIVTMILASAAISIVIPKTQLNIISGLDQAFSTFLTALHLKWLLPVVIIMVLVGGFGGMAAWVIGPTKGIVVAAEDGCAPSFLRLRNKKQVPIAVLLLQWVIVLLLCGLILFIQFISTSYWILSDLTAQLALLFYVILFAAAIRLRYKTEKKPNAYRIPGGNIGIWVIGLTGIVTCIAAIALGFIPPSSIKIQSTFIYEIILIVGILLFAAPPFIMNKFKK